VKLAIPRDGDGPEYARVTKRLRDKDGLPIGTANHHLQRRYCGEMFAQANDEGSRHVSFEAIVDHRNGRIGNEATGCVPYDLHWNQTSERDVTRMGDSRSVEGREDNVDHVEGYERFVSSPTRTQFKTGSQASLFLRGRFHLC
jgi:hypothetical protein